MECIKWLHSNFVIIPTKHGGYNKGVKTISTLNGVGPDWHQQWFSMEELIAQKIEAARRGANYSTGQMNNPCVYLFYMTIDVI